MWRVCALSIALAAALLLPSPSAAQDVTPTACYGCVYGPDADIMLRLKEMYSWSNQTLKYMPTWNRSAPCSTWLYTQCMRENNTWRIEKLDLGSTKVGGPFPEFITGLEKLRLLYADDTKWTGSLPESFSRLTRLNLIKMGANRLTGPLPTSWSTLVKLVRFAMGNNPVGGTIPDSWKGLPLEEFYLDSSGLSGPLPTVFCNWVNLRGLRIGGNTWTGSIPTCIGRLQKLQLMYLDWGRNITGVIPDTIGNMTSLQGLYLNINQLTGPIPESIGNLKSLKTVFLSGNKLLGPLPQRMGELTLLTSWTMEFNKINGTIPDTIGNMTNVRRILLDNNNLTGMIPPSIGRLKLLDTLLLEGNRFYGPIPQEIVSGCVSLKQFNVASNLLSGPTPGGFASPWMSTSSGQVNYRSNILTGKVNYTFANGTRFCPNNYILSSIKFNCFQISAKVNCTYQDNELGYGAQFADATCQAYCGANNPSGPCGGNGWCMHNRTCFCKKGYVPAWNGGISTCVIAALGGSDLAPPNITSPDPTTLGLINPDNDPPAPDPPALPDTSPPDSEDPTLAAVNSLAGGADFSIQSERQAGASALNTAATDSNAAMGMVKKAVVDLSKSFGVQSVVSFEPANAVSDAGLTATIATSRTSTSTSGSMKYASSAKTGSSGDKKDANPKKAGGLCDLGNDAVCRIDVDCLDVEGLQGCACLSGNSTNPSCVYTYQCLDKTECPVLAKCLFSNGQESCTCDSGYRPLIATAGQAFFQYCAKTKCPSTDPFTGFNCFFAEAGGKGVKKD